MRLSVEPSVHPVDHDFAHDIRVRFVETDAMGIVREAGGMLGLDAGKVEAAVAGIEARRQGLPVDVPDPFFKGPF